MNEFEEYSNADIEKIIDLWVKGERDRYICKRKIIDKVTFERLAEDSKVDLSVRHTQTIYYHWLDVITRKLDNQQRSEEWAERQCMNKITYYVLTNHQ